MAQQSLYRRYRPRRFSEIKGQEHVVRALRNAVATEREGQAYLFSGPRGTGKTTSARILAKVLNCQNPVDGEPCCECESCKSVEAGTSFDVIELDAASNNKVDDIRELIERVNLSTPGRHKVYILDEVHMLTPGAEAALLKTLEEPPPHVVFVLATTDPQKVRDTIRSRTQHLSFHLLNEQELQDHVRWVAEDAGIELTDDAVEAVVRQGAGSARDTLSALEVVAAGGGVAPEALPLDEFVEAIIEHDAGRALAAIAASAHLGRDARSVAEAVLAHLRECFLSIMAPELVQLPQHRAEVVAEQAHRLGAAAAVRAMEGLGDILVEMRHAPDPRVLLEVALVKLTSAAVGNDVAALMARIERLERQVAQGGGGANTGPIPRPVATDPATGRAVLGGRARQSAPAPAEAAAPPTEPARVSPSLPPVAAAPVAAAPVASEPAAPPVARPSVDPTPAGGVPRPAAPAAAAAPSAHATSTADLAKLFEDVVKPGLKGMAKALFFAAVPRGMRDGVLVLVVPNEGHLKRASEYQAEIEKQLGAAAGTPARIVLETENAPATGGPRGGRTDPRTTESADASSMDDLNDLADLGELRDAPPEDHKSPVQRVQDMFPGSELIEGGD